jgi:hypothetical protein
MRSPRSSGEDQDRFEHSLARVGKKLRETSKDKSLDTTALHLANSACPHRPLDDSPEGSQATCCSRYIRWVRNFAFHKRRNGRTQARSLPARTPDAETTMHVDAIHDCIMNNDHVRPTKLYGCVVTKERRLDGGVR